MDARSLIAAGPSLHQAWGSLVSWQASEALLTLLERHLEPDMSTLETGSGFSTVLFAGAGARHTAVTPDPGEEERIRVFCEEQRIDTSTLTFAIGRSEEVLPSLSPDPLDVVLIDGAHGFPAPFIDWFYAGRRLRVGGLLIVDDTQIWTGAVLRDFLREESQWELVHDEPDDFAALRRVADGPVGEWDRQPFVLRQSQSTGRSMPRRAVAKARRMILR